MNSLRLPRRHRTILTTLIIIQLLLSLGTLILSSIALDIGLRNDSIESLDGGLLPFAGRIDWNHWANSTFLILTAACFIVGFYTAFTYRLVTSRNGLSTPPSVFTVGLVMAIRSFSVAAMCLAFFVFDLVIALPALFGDILLFYLLHRWTTIPRNSEDFELEPTSNSQDDPAKQ